MDRNKAHRLAARVTKQLGPGWAACVYENLGWHVSWFNGAVNLHYSEPYKSSGVCRYWAMVGDINGLTGSTIFTPRHCQHFRRPIQAVEAACCYALKQYRSDILPIIASVEKVMGSE